MKKRLTGFVFSAALFGTLFSGSPAYATYQEAADALKEKDYVFALEEFTRLAEKEHNSEARYQLARMIENGWGIPADEIQALKVYRKAAEEGNEKAALKVGNAHYSGKFAEKDYSQALKWFKVAADKGNYLAQYNLGLMYEEGLGTKKDPVKAFQFYSQSADQGYHTAQAALGRMYVGGIGTPQDYGRALRWYKLAADQGDVDSQMKLAELFSNTEIRGLPFNPVGAHMYYNLIAAYAPSPKREQGAALRDKMAEKMRPEEIQVAQASAQKWRKKKREESIPNKNQNDLLQVEDGQPATKKDAAKTENKEAEKPQEITVKTELDALIVAAGVNRRILNKAIRENNFSEVLKILKAKAEKGDELSMIVLGDLFVLGQGMESSDYQEAFNWFKKAADKNNAIALFRLAPMYCEGNPVQPDLAECYKLFLLARKFANEGSVPTIDETIKMLDSNLDQSIRDEGKKLADNYGKEPEKAKDEAKADKGLISSFKDRFFSDDEEDDDLDAIERPEEEPAEKQAEAEGTKEEENKTQDVPAGDDIPLL